MILGGCSTNYYERCPLFWAEGKSRGGLRALGAGQSLAATVHSIWKYACQLYEISHIKIYDSFVQFGEAEWGWGFGVGWSGDSSLSSGCAGLSRKTEVI